jgi:hypothetical protein
MFIQTLCLIFSPVDFCFSPSGEMDEQTSQAWIFVVAKKTKVFLKFYLCYDIEHEHILDFHHTCRHPKLSVTQCLESTAASKAGARDRDERTKPKWKTLKITLDVITTDKGYTPAPCSVTACAWWALLKIPQFAPCLIHMPMVRMWWWK